MNFLSPAQKYFFYRAGLSFACGVALSSAFAPAHAPYYLLAALIVQFYLVAITEKLAHVAIWGMAFGFGWFVTGINWVYFSMYHYGYMPLEWTYVTTAVFSLALALFPTVAFVVANKVTCNPALRMALSIPGAFVLSEWLRSWVLTGFPWLNPAYGVVDWALAGWAPLLGAFGVLVALSWISGLVAAAWFVRRQWIYSIACLITVFSILLLGMTGRQVTWSEPAGEVTLRLVQPNFEPRLLQQSISERFDEVYFYLDNVTVEKAEVDAVVLPESVYPLAWQQMPAKEHDCLMQWVKTEQKDLVFNAFWFNESTGRFANAAMQLDKNGNTTVYQKRHLVPFGEFVPWGFHWFIEAMRIPMADLEAGSAQQPLMNIAGHTASVNLCYENLFGSEWIEVFEKGNPAFLMNLSNLKWFGPVKAAEQHLQVSQMRALEMARPLVSVTNSGATALIDEKGIVQKRLPTDQEGVLDVTVTAVKGEPTPYVKLGDWPALLLALAMFVAAGLICLFKKRSQKG